MLQAILMWSGAVLAVVVLLLMALGPVIVEVDSWWYERRRRRRVRKIRASRAVPARHQDHDDHRHGGTSQVVAPDPVAPASLSAAAPPLSA